MLGESFRFGGVDFSFVFFVILGVFRILNWVGGRRGGRSFGVIRCFVCCYYEFVFFLGFWRMSLLL